MSYRHRGTWHQLEVMWRQAASTDREIICRENRQKFDASNHIKYLRKLYSASSRH
jgi:hypothetical protein